MARDKFLFFSALFFSIAFFLALVLSLPTRAGEPFKPSKDIFKPTEKGIQMERQKLPSTQKPRWVEPNMNRPGSDYKSFWLSGGCEQCQKACAKDPKCKAYTYVKPVKKGAKARCLLKFSVPPPVPNKRCISGVKPTKRPIGVKPAPKVELQAKVKPLPKQQPDQEELLPQGDIEEPEGYPEDDYVSSEEDYVYEEYPEQYAEEGISEEKRNILDELGYRVWEGPGEGAQEEAMQAEGMPEEPTEEKPYAGGVATALIGEKPELLITDIRMRNPNKKELIINKELKPQDWVFEVKVLNIGKTPVSNVGVLVAVKDERAETVIEDTMEHNRGAMARVYMRPSRKILSGKSVEVNAIVDPIDEYKENNEENNLFTKHFKLIRR